MRLSAATCGSCCISLYCIYCFTNLYNEQVAFKPLYENRSFIWSSNQYGSLKDCFVDSRFWYSFKHIEITLLKATLTFSIQMLDKQNSQWIYNRTTSIFQINIEVLSYVTLEIWVLESLLFWGKVQKIRKFCIFVIFEHVWIFTLAANQKISKCYIA